MKLFQRNVLTKIFCSYTGDLLNLNNENAYQCNRRVIIAQVTTFAFGWLGRGATIWCMPLLDTMVMCGDTSPVVVSICDCTIHMFEDGKKDTTYIA